MTTLIEVVCPLSQKDMEASVEHYFKEMGDLLIGRRAYQELDAVLLVTQVQCAANLIKHRKFLDYALQQGFIESCEYVTCTLVTISLDASLDIWHQMHDFPLCPGESWFPAVNRPNQVYICLGKQLMTRNQAEWLIVRQATWVCF